MTGHHAPAVHSAISSNQELVKVPCDQPGPCFLLQIFVYGMGVLAVYIDLGHEQVGAGIEKALATSKLLDLGIGTWLLTTKLVAVWGVFIDDDGGGQPCGREGE